MSSVLYGIGIRHLSEKDKIGKDRLDSRRLWFERYLSFWSLSII